MVWIINFKAKNKNGERGAALVTVLFISLLLLTASAAMLTAVGSNSKNTTDILSETKAYYAAETGLQASINVLRNTANIDYSQAVADPDLSTWLPAYVGGQVPIGSGTGTEYSIQVSNPDTGAVTNSSTGKFTSATGAQIALNGKTLYIPNSGASARTEVTFTDVAAGTPTSPNTSLGTFTVVKINGGSTTVATGVNFRVDYRILTPQSGVVSIYGKVTQTDAASPIVITFQSPEYRLLGNSVCLYSDQTTASQCPAVFPAVTPSVTLSLSGSSSASFYGRAMTSGPSPYRLKVTSTGYGPNGAKKTLEAIVRRNYFDGYDSPATMSLIGPHNDAYSGTFIYNPGSSSGVTYSGGDCNSRCIPSFAVTDAQNLADINAANAGHIVNPGSQLVEFALLPSWLQSPVALDAVISRLRITAQHSGTYTTSGSVSNPGNANGTGITFCEGNCSVGDGGGLLVVTGKLSVNGNFDFNGLIIVAGQGGWHRSGGGNGTISGTIVIAPIYRSPYTTPPTLSPTFLAPSYDINGGGNSDVINTDINLFIDNTSAISDIMAGVAEK